MLKLGLLPVFGWTCVVCARAACGPQRRRSNVGIDHPRGWRWNDCRIVRFGDPARLSSWPYLAPLSTAPARRHGFLFVDGTIRPDTIRSENYPAADRFRSTRASASQVIRKEGLSRLMTRSAQYRPECNQTAGRVP